MIQKGIRVYADTSVYGGVHDEEFSEASSKFFNQVKSGRFHLVISPVVDEELQDAPRAVRTLYNDIASLAEPAGQIEEAVRLQDAYLRAGIVTGQWADDALHVAIAAVSRCSLLVSWNFKHIVHFDKIALYNAINIVEGYREIGIHTHGEVIEYENEDV